MVPAKVQGVVVPAVSIVTRRGSVLLKNIDLLHYPLKQSGLMVL
jgi:hypothetical protein